MINIKIMTMLNKVSEAIMKLLKTKSLLLPFNRNYNTTDARIIRDILF